MYISKEDVLKSELEYWKKEVRERKYQAQRSCGSLLEAKRALNKAMLAYDENIESLGFVDCPILENIACSKAGEVMRKDWRRCYGSDVKRNNRTYQLHRLICFTFGNEENYPQEFLDLYCDVHHKNGNHSDNRADNLCFVTKEYHIMLTHRKAEFNDDLRKQLIEQQFNIYSLMFENPTE